MRLALKTRIVQKVRRYKDSLKNRRKDCKEGGGDETMDEPAAEEVEPCRIPAPYERVTEHQQLFLDNLLPEILLNVFECLSYEDLKLRVPLVCHRFNAMLQKKIPTSASQIDKALFRDAPKAPPAKGKVACELNPTIAKLKYMYTEDIMDVKYGDDKLVDISLCRENVCSPAATRAVVISMTRKGSEAPMELQGTGDGGAVTMLDLMTAVVDAVRNTWDKAEISDCWWDGLDQPEIVDGVLRVLDGYHATGNRPYWALQRERV